MTGSPPARVHVEAGQDARTLGRMAGWTSAVRQRSTVPITILAFALQIQHGEDVWEGGLGLSSDGPFCGEVTFGRSGGDRPPEHSA